MTISEIQKAVETLPIDERMKLTSWLVSRYPTLNVGKLMRHAMKLVDEGEWAPEPPGDDNCPTGKVLEHALRVAEELDLGK